MENVHFYKSSQIYIKRNLVDGFADNALMPVTQEQNVEICLVAIPKFGM